MIKTPLISIIVPVYNSEKYLGMCLDSLLMQTYKNLEIICINDGSEDNSLQLLQKYAKEDKRIKIIDQKNSGQSHARNKGLKVAKGEYISFVDSDDWVSLTLYNKFVKALNNSKERFDTYMFNYTSYIEHPDKEGYINKLGVIADKWINRNPENIYDFTDCISPFSGNMGIWNKIYDKKLLKKNNIKFEEDYIFEDQLFYVQTLVESKKIYINYDVQYFYRHNDTSTVHTLGGNAFDIFRILNKIDDILKAKGLYDRYKYAALQHKYQEYAGLLMRVIPPLKEQFFKLAQQNLKIMVDKSFDENIIRKLFNNKIYYDMISNDFTGFMKKM